MTTTSPKTDLSAVTLEGAPGGARKEEAPKLQFTTDRREAGLIRKIAARAMGLEGLRNEVILEASESRPGRVRRRSINVGDIEMDVSATHASGNPIRLEALLNADDFNFAHDIYGIRRHLNRETGQLENFFSPRYSGQE